MIKVNYLEFKNCFTKKVKIALCFTLLLFVLFLISVFSFSFFINYLNKIILLPLSILITSIFFFFFCFSLFAFYLPFKKNLKHIDHVYYGEKIKSRGKVVSIGEMVSLPCFGKGKEVILKDEVATWVIYFDIDYEDFFVSIGDEITVITSNSFVVAYEKN